MADQLETLVLSTDEVAGLLNISECIDIQGDVFRALDDVSAVYPQKCRLYIKPSSGKTVYQAGYVASKNALAARITSSFGGNPSKYKLPRTMRLSVLYDDKTGFPLAIMDGTYVMAVSRGSSAALSAKLLSKKLMPTKLPS